MSVKVRPTARFNRRVLAQRMDAPVLADAARALLVTHAISAIVTAGSSAHLGVLGLLLLRRGAAPAKLVRMHVRITTVGYALTFMLGSLAYPAFRILIRGYYLDRYEPWASNAFDMKEAFLLLGIPVVAGIAIVGRSFELPRDRPAALLLGVLGTAIALIVVTAAVLGIVVTSVKGPR